MEKNVTVRKSNIILFLLLTIPFFQIDFLMAQTDWMGKAYTVCQLLAGVVIILLLFKDRLWKKLPPVFIFFAALLLVMCIGAATEGGGIKRTLEYSFATLILCLIFEYGILKDLKAFLLAEMIFFGTLTAANFLSVLIFPEGMYKYLDFYSETWLLGFKSGHIAYQLAFLFFTVIYIVLFVKDKASGSPLKRRDMIIFYIGLAVTFASNLLVKNLTAVLILIPLIIIAAFPKFLDFIKVMNSLVYAGLGVFLNLLFVVFRGQELFRWLIEGILHKSMDLTKRTLIWDSALEAIKAKPVAGHGYQTFIFSPTVETTHNEFIEVLYKSGIIGLIIFLALLAFAVILLFKNRRESDAKWTALFTGAFFLMFTVEQYAFAFFFYLFLFAWHAKDLRQIAEDQEKARAAAALKNPNADEGGRVRKSARNVAFTVFANVAAILIGLIAQKLFIDILGLEYSGLNGLFSNVIAMLAIVDLGIGEAVVFNLYKPLKEKDEETICSLMRFYRKAFHIVALVIALIGLCLIPALPYIAKTTTVEINTTLIYLIFLADVVLSYFLSYKRAILYADQKNYYISIVHMLYLIGMNTAQLLMLYFTHNYFAYLLAKLAFRVLENIVITVIADKKYPFLKKKEVRPLNPEIRADIKKKTGALFFHKIGTFVVNGTDSILISVFFSLTTAGLYSNYYLVTDALTKLINPAMQALTPSVGNLLVTDEKERSYQIFKRIRFMNFWIASFSATCLLALIQPFISLWFGAQYLLPTGVAAVLSVQFFQFIMRGCYSAFQDAAGIFYENRFVPLAESVVNLAASIILLKIFGLAGVFMGTIASSLVLWCFSYPKFVYKKLFGRSIKQYALEMLGYFGLFAVICTVTYFAVTLLNSVIAAEGILLLIADALVCFVISNGLLALIFMKSDCFRYFTGLIRNTLAERSH